MALVLADRVLETTTTTGSGTITLAGAKAGYQSFSVVGNGNTTYYTIAGITEWEVGIGTYTSSGTTLSRDTVLSSSSGGGKVTFSAGSKDVFVTYPAGRSVESTSATITTLNGTTLGYTSANITTVTGTTISATNMGAQATTHLQAASANITTITGTTIGSTTGTTGLRASSAQITTLTGVTTLSGTNFTATSLTLTNALAVASGGSGRASATAYAVICGGTTSTGAQQSIASVGNSGQVLTSNGAGALPTFQAAASGAQDYIVQSYGIV